MYIPNFLVNVQKAEKNLSLYILHKHIILQYINMLALYKMASAIT